MTLIKALELRKFVAPEIITGEEACFLVGRYLAHFGSEKPMIVTDKKVRAQPWFKVIIASIDEVVGSYVIFDSVTPNPKDFEAMMGAEMFLSEECDLIIAIGGGSPMDCAKCITIVSTNGGHILDYEGVDQINLPGPPLICIPTTSGTAADVSQFAIINDTGNRIKKAIISKKVVPDLALIDPIPLMTMDMYLTACTGMDALTHAIEAYASNAHSTMTDLHALEAIRLIHRHLRAACIEERSLETMYYMMIASTEAGLAFSNASLGAVHAMAHSLGGLLDLPHGECNSILLQHVIEFNYQAIPDRFASVAEAMGIDCSVLDADQIKSALVAAVSDLRESVGIPPYIEIEGVGEEQRTALVDAALDDPCMITNPREMNHKEVGDIFDKIFRRG